MDFYLRFVKNAAKAKHQYCTKSYHLKNALRLIYRGYVNKKLSSTQ